MDLQASLPTYDDLFEPTIKALKALGGSGSIQEIYDKVGVLYQIRVDYPLYSQG